MSTSVRKMEEKGEGGDEEARSYICNARCPETSMITAALCFWSAHAAAQSGSQNIPCKTQLSSRNVLSPGSSSVRRRDVMKRTSLSFCCAVISKDVTDSRENMRKVSPSSSAWPWGSVGQRRRHHRNL